MLIKCKKKKRKKISQQKEKKSWNENSLATHTLIQTQHNTTQSFIRFAHYTHIVQSKKEKKLDFCTHCTLVFSFFAFIFLFFLRRRLHDETKSRRRRRRSRLTHTHIRIYINRKYSFFFFICFCFVNFGEENKIIIFLLSSLKFFVVVVDFFAPKRQILVLKL